MAPYVVASLYAAAGSVGVISGGIWGAIGIVGALLAALVTGVGLGRFPRPDKAATIFVCLLLATAALSVFHAVDVPLALRVLLKLASILLPLLLLASPDLVKQGQAVLRFVPRLTLLTMAMMVALSVMLVAAIRLYGPDSGEVTKLNRGFSYLLLMNFPLLGYLFSTAKTQSRNKWILGGFLLLMLCGLALTHSRATQMGVFVAFAVFLGGLILPTLMTYALGFLSLVSVLWPWGAGYAVIHAYDYVARLPASWLHRVEIWDGLYYRVIESPIFGHGIGNAYKLDWLAPHGAMYRYMTGPAAHPHNAMVQLWVELGVWGAGLGVLFAAMLLKGILALPRHLQALGLGAFAYGYCLLMSAYNFWTDSLWSALALCLFAFAVVAAQSRAGAPGDKLKDS